MNWIKTLRHGFTAVLVAVAGAGVAMAPLEAEAKRLGGGRPAGMQRQMPPKQPAATPDQAGKPAQQQGTQPQNAAAPQAGAAQQAAGQAGRRSWMGPVAGLAAGLGIAALASHFGFGEELANFMTMALLAVVAMVVIGWLMRRFGARKAQGPQLAGAGAPFGGQNMARQAEPASPAAPAYGGGSGMGLAGGSGVSAASLAALPADFDVAGFERIAKMIFIRMQAANDAANLDDLRKFTTPELFASLRLDLQDRGPAAQQTDVMQLQAEVVDTARDDGQLVVSVRFHGLIREDVNAGAEPFDELWHLVRPLDESREWAIAGITPLEATA
ncbi:MAG: Tim44 domain-containing protein [Aquabacterium sp.]